jgi:hypothetical protein
MKARATASTVLESFGMELLIVLKVLGIMLKDTIEKLVQAIFLIQTFKQHTLKEGPNVILTSWMKCHLPPRFKKTHADYMVHY